MNRVLARSGAALAVAGSALLAWAGAASAYGPGGGSATVSATVGYSSSGVATLAITGAGFGADETVQLSVSPGTFLGVATSGPSGAVTVSEVLPGGYGAGGDIQVVATGTTSGRTASTYVYLARGSASPSPCTTSAAAGAAVRLVSVRTAACLSSPLPAAAAAPPGPAATTGAAAPQQGSRLAFTGANVSIVVVIGALVLGLGGLLVLASRRRQGPRR